MSNITQIETRLNEEAGLNFLRAAIVNETPISVSTFHIGTAVDFYPDPTASEVSGTLVYTGNANQISTSQDADNNLIYTITLNENIGSFSVGNIMVFANVAGDGGAGFPLWQTVLPYATQKLATVGEDLGNVLVIRTTINIVDGSALTTITINPVNELYGIIPSVATEVDLPAPSPSANPQYIIQNVTGSGVPAIATLRASDNLWYANGFLQRLDDHRLGWISGGWYGDGYYVIRNVSTVFGGFFETANGSFTGSYNGGDNWAVATNTLDGGIW
jgi:hypothetical protein